MQYSNTGSNPWIKFTYRYQYPNEYAFPPQIAVEFDNAIESNYSMIVPSNWITNICWAPLSNTPPRKNIIEAFIRNISGYTTQQELFMKVSTKSVVQLHDRDTTINHPYHAHEDILSCLKVWQLAKRLLTSTINTNVCRVWIFLLHS